MNFKKNILLPFLLTRLCLLAAGVFSLHFNGVAPASSEHFHYTEPAASFLAVWTRWDAQWYLAIADKGYKISEAVRQNYDPVHSAGFFPLYPLCIRGLTFITHSPYVSAILISNASLLLFLFFLWRLISLEASEETASRAVLLYLVFPSSFFLSSAYADSLFLCVTFSAFCFARIGNWGAASLLGFFASFAKPAGALLFFPLMLELILQKKQHTNAQTMKSTLSLLLIPCGAVLFMIYCSMTFNDPFAFVKWHEIVRGTMGVPWKAFSLYLSWYPDIFTWNNASKDFLFALLFVLLFFYGIRKMRASYSVFSGLHLFLLLSTTVISFMRLSLVLFPCFILLGSLTKNKAVYYPVLAASFLLMILYMSRFSLWDWVG